jgi:thiamine biosynthesis protein ThiC
MEAASSSETPVEFQRATQRYTPEDRILQLATSTKLQVRDIRKPNMKFSVSITRGTMPIYRAHTKVPRPYATSNTIAVKQFQPNFTKLR